MFVILAYDVSASRGSKVMKICRKYLRHIQKSVFEGNISESKLRCLQNELKNVLELDRDRVCIYCLDSVKYAKRVQIGFTEKLDVFL